MADPANPSRRTVTILGSGTSVGVPVIGCDCETCTSSDPRDARTRSSILVRDIDFQWVVDTGPDFRAQCLRENIRKLNAVLYTHAHMDHVTGFDDLRRFTPGREATLPIFATAETMEDLKRMFTFAFNGENRYPGYFKPDPIEISGPFRLGAEGAEGSVMVDPLPVTHGKVETIGFHFEGADGGRFAYVPDCKTMSEEGRERINGVPLLIIDGLRKTPHPTHMNFEEALQFAAEVGAQKTVLTHIADQILHARDEPDLPDTTTIAYDGMILDW